MTNFIFDFCLFSLQLAAPKTTPLLLPLGLMTLLVWLKGFVALISDVLFQYVLFPPYTSTPISDVSCSSVSSSDDEADDVATNDDGELKIITEIWVEPQVRKPPFWGRGGGLVVSVLAPSSIPTLATWFVQKDQNKLIRGRGWPTFKKATI